ncbi:AraC family transcriptional regulator [Chryseobacterium salipaludis]|uniref:helix-turn-helix domain-containing protein n=1 Tax=Chryseobacterium TaxID=59732 RepID=UPI001FF6EC6E|nr:MULTISPECIES: AraC family transcriptional regulator [Chryseobacterium]MCJ8497364.1 AraC family transcriptional regulator [Chryseobacterium salipaludis]MCX3295771.1 AraC family transcriptional regulator [Planobacterium sp. JC490]
MKNLYPELLTQLIEVFTLDELLTNYPELLSERQVPMHCVIWSGNEPFWHEAAGSKHLYGANTFICVAPDVTQRFLKQDNTAAQVILFSTEFFGRSFAEITLLESDCLFSATTACSFQNSICNAETFTAVFMKDLQNIYSPDVKEHHYLIAHNILERILLEGFQNDLNEINPHNYHHTIVLRFKKLINQHLHEKRNTSFYAEKLNITRRALDRSTQIVYRKSAKEFVLDNLTTRAKSLILNSDLSIKEIANSLGFAQESNFSAFFKTHVGTAPTAYRSIAQSPALI